MAISASGMVEVAVIGLDATAVNCGEAGDEGAAEQRDEEPQGCRGGRLARTVSGGSVGGFRVTAWACMRASIALTRRSAACWVRPVRCATT